MHKLSGEKGNRITAKVSLKDILKKFVDPFILIFFPSTCKICGKFLENPGEKIVCGNCLGRAEIHRGEVCPVCGRFYHLRTDRSTICGDCLKERPSFEKHRAAGHYTGTLRQMIILFKYRQHESLKSPLAGLLLKNSEAKKILEGVDLIVPVPLHPARQKERGFNQAELLAEELSRRVRLPVARGVLVKTRKTLAQVSLEAEERKRNLTGAFRVKKPGKIAGRVILLVDDVFTTGSTCRECSGALLEAGAREVRVLTLARA